MSATVFSVSLSPTHRLRKLPCASIRLLAGLGVEGDAHCGATVKHRSRVKADPTQPNLRQVHLIHAELFDELRLSNFQVSPGEIGENITTRGIDLLSLPVGTRLHLGESAIVELTGLRNPCVQLDHFQPGLMKALLGKNDDGSLVRKSGVMGIVIEGGEVKPDDAILFDLLLAWAPVEATRNRILVDNPQTLYGFPK